jgi:membrane protein
MLKGAGRFLLQTAKCYSADHAGSYAAAIAYYTLFSIFPLAVCLLSIGGYFLSNAQRQQLVQRLTSALGGASTSTVAQQVNTVSHGRAGLGIVGLIGALWSASAVFAAIRTGLNVVWNRENPHPWLQQRLLDLLGVLGLALVLLLALLATGAVSYVDAFAVDLLGHGAGGAVTAALSLLLTLLPAVLVFLAFGLLYIRAAPPRLGWRHVWPGALLAAAGFMALSFLFGLYVRFFGHYDKVYGSLGAVVAFLFYAYLVGSLLLFGAELSEQYVCARRLGRVPKEGACDAAAANVPQAQKPTGVLVLKPIAGERDADDVITAAQAFPRQK